MENGVSAFSVTNFIVNFRRADGSIIHRDLKLTDDGKIVPSLPNEFWWGHVDGNLVFKNEAGDVTTVFDRHVEKSDHIEMHGRFLPFSNDVYHHILELFPLNKIGTLPSATAKFSNHKKLRVAILLRTHVINSKFYDLYHKLKNKTDQFDVFPLIDNSRDSVDVIAENIIFHSTADVVKHHLKSSRENLFWWYGDYPLYIAYSEIPDYDYYIMIEYDVHFQKDPILFINTIIERLAQDRSIDLIALDLRRHYNDWAWWKNSKMYFDDIWSIFFPFICISRRALAYLMAVRQNEFFRNIDDQYILHCEPFVAGNLILSGFECYDLNEIIPNSYIISLMKIDGGYCPEKQLDLDVSNVSMIHPVYFPISNSTNFSIENYFADDFDDKNTSIGFPFKNFISIGTYCVVATHLKEAGLRYHSYPFDWLFSNPSMVADCLEDDFAVLLDRQYLVPIENGTKCRHEFYQAQYSMPKGAIFNHQNIADDAQYETFVRRVERLRAALRSPEETLLVMMMGGDSYYGGVPAQIERIKRAANNTPALVLVFVRSYAEPRGKVEVIYKTPGIMIAKFFVQSETSDGMLFDDRADTEAVVRLLHSIRRAG